MKCLLKYFFVLIILGLLQTSCDLREGTIVYDVEFPLADEVDTGGSSGGGGSGGVPSQITNLAASAGSQQNTLTWSAPAGADNYTLYWSASTPVTTSSGNFTLASGTISYTHSGLTSGTTYYYAIASTNSDGTAGLSNEVSGTPSGFSGPPVCNTSGTLTDNDTDLLVHYAFENNLNDVKNANSDGRYYLTNTGGTIKYAQSCAYGQAAYFDSSTGYLENNNFNRTNITSLDSGNFTIALWVNRDADMAEFASAISSKDISNNTGTWGDSIQIDVDEISGNNYIRWNNAPPAGIASQAMITDGTVLSDWSYLTAVHYDNDTAQFYRNGMLVGTHTTFPARWYKMKVGINRLNDKTWKGYIDEVKVYNRAFDGDDVKNACLLYNNCTGVKPAKPDNLTAAGGSGQNVLTWNATNGTDNYTLYWSTDNSSFTAISPVITGTNHTHTGLSGSTTYYYYVKANNVTGASGESNRANATTVPNPPTNLAGTTPANTQQVNLTWTQSLGGLAHSYVIYWKKASGSPISFDPNDNNTYHGKITIDNSSKISHVHGGLDGATQYNYIIRAETAIGGVSTSEPSSNSYSITTNSFITDTIATDNDPDLMVYYDFNDNGTLNSNLMNKSPVTAGSYNLTASGSTIVTAESRFTGNAAAYFDADEGYAYNNDFNDDNITQLSNTGNFTISAWVYPDQDMSKFASIISTGVSTNKDTGAFQMSNTNNSPNKIGMFAQNKDIKLESSATSNNTWYHAVFVKEQNGTDNGTGRFYLDGVEVDNETNFKTGFKKIKIGINRVTQNSWKGYIDEFKVYRRALDATEVNNVYTRDYP